jgi:hypothetical protein
MRVLPGSPAAQQIKTLPQFPPKTIKPPIPRCPPIMPGLDEVRRHAHNLKVAGGLKEGIREQLKAVRLGQPLNKAESPRPGKNGQMVAPNGDPLVRVKLTPDGRSIPGSGQYALVNPKTNEYYLQTNAGGFTHPTTYHGPLSLPKGSRFLPEKKFTAADMRQFEAAANKPDFVKPSPDKPVTLKDLIGRLNELDYGQSKPKNAGAEKMIKSEHPFTYYAVTLKGDPNHIVIKKVLTGGFVPAQPGDGTYSEPIAIK